MRLLFSALSLTLRVDLAGSAGPRGDGGDGGRARLWRPVPGVAAAVTLCARGNNFVQLCALSHIIQEPTDTDNDNV